MKLLTIALSMLLSATLSTGAGALCIGRSFGQVMKGCRSATCRKNCGLPPRHSPTICTG